MTTRSSLLDIIKPQFPGQLVERLGLEIIVDADAYFLKGVIKIRSAARGIDITTELEPLDHAPHLRCKVPEVVILHLCTMIG